MKFNELRLFSSSLVVQEAFYSGILGISAAVSDNEELRLRVGQTNLVFSERGDATPYHFAINIPANKIRDAADWLKRKEVEILYDGDNEIVDFSNWNAESVYFYDGDKNIVEFIARKNTAKISNVEFSPESFLCISEIGVPVNNVQESFFELNKFISVPKYWGDDEIFCAAGDESGLFIIIDKSRKKWFPVNDKACSSDFILDCGIWLDFKNGKFHAGN